VKLFWRQTAVTCLSGIDQCLVSSGRHLSVWYCVWRQTTVTCLVDIVFGIKRPSPVWVVLCIASNGRHSNVYGVRRSFSAYMDSVIKYVTLKMLLNYKHNILIEGFWIVIKYNTETDEGEFPPYLAFILYICCYTYYTMIPISSPCVPHSSLFYQTSY